MFLTYILIHLNLCKCKCAVFENLSKVTKESRPTIVWNVTTYRLVEVYRRFEECISSFAGPKVN
jgi:hypothetical protein